MRRMYVKAQIQEKELRIWISRKFVKKSISNVNVYLYWHTFMVEVKWLFFGL